MKKRYLKIDLYQFGTLLDDVNADDFVNILDVMILIRGKLIKNGGWEIHEEDTELSYN